MKGRMTAIFCSLVIIFHGVAFWGLTNPGTADLFKSLAPVYLISMFLLILISHKGRNNDFWKFITLTYLAGFVIELLGITTEAVFGAYSFGPTLGFKIVDVPVTMGLFWVILIYSVGCLMKRVKIKNRNVRAVVGAVFIALLDYLIEPIAIRQDYWEWTNYDIPVQNYVAWFVFSFFLLLVFNRFRISRSNLVGAVIFVCQLVFFLGLNIVLL